MWGWGSLFQTEQPLMSWAFLLLTYQEDIVIICCDAEQTFDVKMGVVLEATLTDECDCLGEQTLDL